MGGARGRAIVRKVPAKPKFGGEKKGGKGYVAVPVTRKGTSGSNSMRMPGMPNIPLNLLKKPQTRIRPRG